MGLRAQCRRGAAVGRGLRVAAAAASTPAAVAGRRGLRGGLREGRASAHRLEGRRRPREGARGVARPGGRVVDDVLLVVAVPETVLVVRPGRRQHQQGRQHHRDARDADSHLT